MTVNPFRHDLATLDRAARAALDQRAAHFIDGAWVEATKTLPVIDPSSGAHVGEIAAGGHAEVDAAVLAAQKALKSPEWAGLGPLGRERLITKLVSLIEANADALSQIEIIDNGMPRWFAFGPNVLGAADVYRYYAGWPSKLTGTTSEVEAPPGAGRFLGFTRREPIGVVGAIIPWNVPFMLAAWKLAPALAAGCTVVLKPAEDTSLSALYLARLVQDAGFPAGVVNIVTGAGAEAGEALVSHPGVAKISFTGSTVTGRRIGALAGANLKRVTLELGGKSPSIIFDDADLDKAAVGAADAIFLNSGQICVAGSRLYVHDRVHDEVLERIAAHLPTLKVGAGLHAETFMGPLVSARHKAKVKGYIDGARSEGFEVIQGQAVDESEGYFCSPTVVLGAERESQITREEVFGPVVSVYRFHDVEEVIQEANGTEYGLAARVWSQNIGTVTRVSTALECGKVIVNHSGFPYPGLPEGGYKASGHGRDLGPDAVEQCLQTKTVLMAG